MDFLPDPVLAHLREVSAEPDLSGTRYHLRGLLGRGGMGMVYDVFDEALHRNVALKVSHAATPIPLDEEARVIASLDHPGVVPLYEAGTLADGRSFYAMKRVDGERLDQWISKRDPPTAARLNVFARVCETVAFAHSRGVIHRDLKPRNIMVGAFGQVLVLDWGVAGVVAGTREFAAPEVLAGAVSGVPGDVYALGAILRFLLPSPSRAALAIALRAMAPSPADRYETVTALLADVERYRSGEAVTVYRETLAERAMRFARRNQTLLLLLGAYVAVRFALFFFARR